MEHSQGRKSKTETNALAIHKGPMRPRPKSRVAESSEKEMFGVKTSERERRKYGKFFVRGAVRQDEGGGIPLGARSFRGESRRQFKEHSKKRTREKLTADLSLVPRTHIEGEGPSRGEEVHTPKKKITAWEGRKSGGRDNRDELVE